MVALAVVRAIHVIDFIHRHLPSIPLADTHELILVICILNDVFPRNVCREHSLDEPATVGHAPVQVHGAHQRLEHVLQDSFVGVPVLSVRPCVHHHKLMQAQVAGDLREGLARYQLGAYPGQKPLVRLREPVKKHFCDNEVQNAVP